MGYILPRQEREALLSCGDGVRYKHAVDRIADWGEVWSLYGDDGWVLSGSGAALDIIE